MNFDVPPPLSGNSHQVGGPNDNDPAPMNIVRAIATALVFMFVVGLIRRLFIERDPSSRSWIVAFLVPLALILIYLLWSPVRFLFFNARALVRFRLNRCVHCGYSPRDLPAPVCPECGKDPWDW